MTYSYIALCVSEKDILGAFSISGQGGDFRKTEPDADYDENYGDEIDIPEDDMDDEDFED